MKLSLGRSKPSTPHQPPPKPPRPPKQQTPKRPPRPPSPSPPSPPSGAAEDARAGDAEGTRRAAGDGRVLPPQWTPVTANGATVFYWNSSTGETSASFPAADWDVDRALVASVDRQLDEEEAAELGGVGVRVVPAGQGTRARRLSVEMRAQPSAAGGGSALSQSLLGNEAPSQAMEVALEAGGGGTS